MGWEGRGGRGLLRVDSAQDIVQRKEESEMWVSVVCVCVRVCVRTALLTQPFGGGAMVHHNIHVPTHIMAQGSEYLAMLLN